MRKGSSDNQPNSENPWSIGTKFTKSNTFNRNEPTKKQKNVPRLKDRNPFQILKKAEQCESEAESIQEITQALAGFSVEHYDIGQFMGEVIVMFDQFGASNTKVIDFILSNLKIKELFKDLTKNQCKILIEALLKSINQNIIYQNRESCIRLLIHIFYETNDIETQDYEKAYKQLSKLAFDNQVLQQQMTPTQNLQGDGSGSAVQTTQIQQGQQKLQRLSINCISNMIIKQTPFSKNNVEIIFNKLKQVFDQLMKKGQTSFRSKKFIQTMSTVIRGLQFCLSDTYKIKINENEVVKLFLSFYKLLFLGTPFAEKMLQIKLEETKQGKPQNPKFVQGEEEEVKGDSGSFIIDTSDFSEQSDGGLMEENKESPGSNEGLIGSDPYMKIKNHSMLCLQYLFKVYNKQLFNYWTILFPSYFMKPQSEFTQYLNNFEQNYQEYSEKSNSYLKREPTLFYLLKASEYTSKMKCTLSFTITLLLENSHISKIQGVLEKEDQPLSQQLSTFTSVANALGQFLRFLHYQLLEMITSEKDQYLLSHLIKIIGTLLHVTPYKNMKKGLIEQILKVLWHLLTDESQVKIDQGTKQSILNTISITINLTDVKDEVQEFLFSKKETNLLYFLFTDEKHRKEFKESQETLLLIQKISKTFNTQLLEVWDPHFLRYLQRILKESYDKKKTISILKMLEEWLKSFQQSNNLLDENEEGEDNLPQVSQGEQQLKTPFVHESFKKFLNQIIEHYFHQKESTETNIAILSILQLLDSNQWKETFSEQTQNYILEFSFSMKQPAIYKSSSIKFFGYLVYLDHFKTNPKFIEQIFNMIFENSSDNNLNVQIRNSWVLANLCCTQQEFKDPYLIQETLRVSINYATSNKEKVIANSLRALGYLLKHMDLVSFQQEVLANLNKSQIYLNKLPPQMFSQSSQKVLTLQNILKLIIDNLNNKNPKITWNSCVAIGNIMQNETLKGDEIIFSEKTVEVLIQILVGKPNYKTRIHAAQTLMKYKNIQQLGGPRMLSKLWEALLNSFDNINQMVASYSEQKFVPALEKQIIDLWVHVAKMTENADYINEFLDSRAFALLQIMKEYLRKELKVPMYSGFYDEMDLFKIETENIFKENPHLEEKLERLKVGLIKVRDLIKDHEHVHVSFGVFEGFNQLSSQDVKQYRELEVLKVTKSNFDPKFDDKL